MSRTLSLGGRHILVTRPQEQAEALCALITNAGGIPLRLPLLRIEPTPVTPALRAQLDAAKTCALVVFTSVNAVRYALAVQPDPAAWPATIAVIGGATAQAVISAGLAPPLKPAHEYSSEGLLALPQLAQLNGKQVLLVTGRNGRETLAETLTARGAVLRRADVYLRIPMAASPEQVRTALEHAAAAVVTSGETLERLVAVTPAELRTRLFMLPVIVPGARVLQLARSLGFTAQAGVPQPMSDAGILQALATLINNPQTGL